MAILRLFSALRERGGAPNRKKVAKSSLFLFLRLADRRDGTNPAKDESHTHRNQGMHLQSDKKPPEGGFIRYATDTRGSGLWTVAASRTRSLSRRTPSRPVMRRTGVIGATDCASGRGARGPARSPAPSAGCPSGPARPVPAPRRAARSAARQAAPAPPARGGSRGPS